MGVAQWSAHSQRREMTKCRQNAEALAHLKRWLLVIPTQTVFCYITPTGRYLLLIYILQSCSTAVQSRLKNIVKILWNVMIEIGSRICVLLYVDNILPIADSAKNLGLTIDNQLHFSSHVSALVTSSYCVLKLLYIYKNYLCFNIKRLPLTCKLLCFI